PNWTAPATSANSVSSRPRPTPTPGWNLVPRWRIRISPALTFSPPNRFTPRRCAFESRPLRELEAPFLCAMVRLPRDSGDLDAGQRLAVSLPLVVPGLVLELVDFDLRALGVLHHGAGDREAGQRRGVRGQVLTVHDQECGKAHLGAGLADDLLDGEHVTDGDLVLLAAGFDDRVHR